MTDEELLDLEHRLLNARYGTELNDTQFQYGFPAGELKKVVEHWLLAFDWRAQEEQLNQFPQFKTEIEGFDVHFIRVLPAVKTVQQPPGEPDTAQEPSSEPGAAQEPSGEPGTVQEPSGEPVTEPGAVQEPPDEPVTVQEQPGEPVKGTPSITLILT